MLNAFFVGICGALFLQMPEVKFVMGVGAKRWDKI
jgi:hypothetical protein